MDTLVLNGTVCSEPHYSAKDACTFDFESDGKKFEIVSFDDLAESCIRNLRTGQKIAVCATLSIDEEQLFASHIEILPK